MIIKSIIQFRFEASLLLGGLLLVFLSQSLSPILPLESSWAIYPPLITGIILFLLGVLSIQNNSVQMWANKFIDKFSLFSELYPSQLIYLIFGLFLGYTTVWSSGFGDQLHNAPLAITSWLLAMLFVVLGGWKFSESRSTFDKRSLILFTLFFIIGFLVRGFNTGEIPIVLTGDEGSAGLSAVRFVKNETNNILNLGWFSFPSLYFYTQSLSIRIFGQTIEAIRLPSAFIGGLTVGVVYLLGKVLFGEFKGVLAAIFLVGFHHHIHFSRIALNNIWDGLWFSIILALLVYGWKNDNQNAFIFSGIALGLSQYFYVGVHLLLIIIPVWLILNSFSDMKKFRKNAVPIMLMIIATIVTLLPLGFLYFKHPDMLTAPMQRVQILGKWLENEILLTGKSTFEVLLSQVSLAIKGFYSIPLVQFYPAYIPFLRSTPATLFFIGLSLLILKINDYKTKLIFLWVLGFIGTSALSTPTPAAQRLVGVVPAVALIVGYGLGEITELLSSLWIKYQSYLKYSALIIIFLVTLSDLKFYYQDYTPTGDLGGVNTFIANSLAEDLEGKDSSWHVYFFGFPRMGYKSLPSLQYLIPQIEGTDVNSSDELASIQIQDSKAVFVFLPEQEELLNQVTEKYPSGKLVERYDALERFNYWYYEIGD